MPKSIEQIKNRVMELSQKFLQLNDLLKEAVNVNERALDIIERIKGARLGIVYELADLQKEYEELKSFGPQQLALPRWSRQAELFDEVGRSIIDLIEQFQHFDSEVQKQEKELYDLRRERDKTIYQLQDLGADLSEAKEEFTVGESGWFAKALLSPRPRALEAEFSKEFKSTIEDFTQMIRNLPPGELDGMIDEKGAELNDILNKIKLAEADLEELKKMKEIRIGFFDQLASSLKTEVVETEKTMVNIKKWLQDKPPSYKQVYLFLLDKVDEALRKSAEKFRDSLTDLEERIKVTVTPKQSDSWVEKLKKYVQGLWNDGRELLKGLTNARAELDDFAHELEQIGEERSSI